MITDYKDRSLWEKPIEHLEGKTMRELFGTVGNSTYDLDTYIAGEYGDELMRHTLSCLNFADENDPGLADYWRERGLERTVHKGVDKSHDWIIYVPTSARKPENAGKKYPAFFVHWEIFRTFLDMERWGFVDLAAEHELIVIASQHGRRDDVFNETLDLAIENYPVDPDRVFLFGHSFTAVCSGLHAVNFADRVAGLCLCGSQYYGADSSDEQIARTMELGMPVFFIHSMKQSRCLLPFSIEPEHPMSPKRYDTVITRSPFTLGTSYAEQIFWRRINGLKLFPMEDMRDLHLRADNICEKKLGVPLEHTYIRRLGGLTHYFGDVCDKDGVCRMRIVGVEHGNHFPPAYAAELSWQFLRCFSRDPETRKTVYDPAPSWPDPTAHRVPEENREYRPAPEKLWDVRFMEVGNISPRMLIEHHASPDFCFESYVRGENGEKLMEHMRPYLFFGGEAQGVLLKDYWRALGLERTEHDGENGRWVSYIPADGKNYPVFCLLKNRRHRFEETDMWGFAHMAARTGAAVLVIENSNDDKAIRAIIAEAAKLYPCDAGKVYLCGHSYTGAVAGRVSLALADVVAGVCIMNAQYNGEDNIIEEYDLAKKCRMPRVDIHGTSLESGLLPYNVTPDFPMPAKYAYNVSTSDYSALPSFEEQRFWRDINNCPAAGNYEQITETGKAAEIAFERINLDNRERLRRMYSIQTLSNDPVERVIGVACDRTEMRKIGGVAHYIGDALDYDGNAMFRTVAVEGAPLFPAAQAANLAREFLTRFTRGEDGELIIG